jgi:hypothetical protein
VADGRSTVHSTALSADRSDGGDAGHVRHGGPCDENCRPCGLCEDILQGFCVLFPCPNPVIALQTLHLQVLLEKRIFLLRCKRAAIARALQRNMTI